MRYLTLMVLLIMVIGSTHSQSSIQLFSIHFNSDQAVLDRQDYIILNKIIAAYKAAPYSEITLSAHTDNNANESYNIGLSKRRALSVKTFLQKNGVDAAHIIWKHYGESKPVNDNQNDGKKAINRRVEVRIESHRFDNVAEMMKAAGGNCKQTFTINPTKPNTIKGKSGSVVIIPANTLVDWNGKPVTNPVTVSIEEFLKPADALFQSLSTQTTTGDVLETGGMITIEASAGNNKVMIKKGAQVQVQLPTIEVKPDMELFTGKTNATGIMEWEATGKPFGAPLNAVKLNTADIRQMSFYFKIPRPPRMPYKGYAPYMMKYASKWKHLTLWQHITLSAVEKSEKMGLHREQVDILNKSATDKYMKRLAEYAVRLKIYKRDSLIYEKRYSESFNNWVDKQIKLQEIFLASLKPTFTDSASLKNLVAFGADNKIVSPSELRYFKSNEHSAAYQHLAGKHAGILTSLEQMKTMGLVKSYDRYAYGNYICSFENYRGKRSGQNPEPLTPSIGLVTVAQATSIEEVAKSISTSLNAEETAAIEQEVTYSAYISSFGTINCDRFTKTPPNMFVNINVPIKTPVQVAFYLPSQKSFLYASLGNNGYNVRIPKNTEYTVFIMSLQQQQPLFYTQKGEASSSVQITPDLKPVTLAYLRDQFQSL